jgi:hypothetical protein
MKRTIITLTLMIMMILPVVSATTNLDFRLDVEEKLFYPNEKIPLNISVINRDSAFSARDAILTVNIGDRFYTYELNDLNPGYAFEKEIILPEFPAGTQNIKGEINYTGLLDEKFIETSYGSFEVLFPPIERYPRNVFVSNYELPEKILNNKEYDVSITITNDGDVDTDLLVEFGSLDEFFEENTKLSSGKSTTVNMKVKFENPGISLIEARAYAIVNGEKYLLNYRGQKTFVQSEKIAKLIFNGIELVKEGDNKINQKDTVQLKILIKNEGDTATDVKGELSSYIEGITVSDNLVYYITIASKDSYAPSNDTFEISTEQVSEGINKLNLKLSYQDSEYREKIIEIPLDISAEEEKCLSDNDCEDNEECNSKGMCVSIDCPCGVIRDKQCIKYECCSNADCGEFQTCNREIKHCVSQSGCINVLQNGDSNDKLDILFIGAEYDDYSELKKEISTLTDLDGMSKYIGFFSIEPFKSLKNKFNIWMIKAPKYSTQGSGSCGQSCSEAIDFNQDSEYISLCPNMDTTITIFKKAKFRSCAGGSGQWNSLSCQSDSTKGKLILHESGHSIGKLADEYEEPSKGSRPWGPNCADTIEEAQSLWGDLVGVNNVGFYEGCSYTSDNYRNMRNNIMRSHYSADTYGPVNERAIIKQLEVYK